MPCSGCSALAHQLNSYLFALTSFHGLNDISDPQYKPPFSAGETNSNPKFWKVGGDKKNEYLEDSKSSCHKSLPGETYYVSCQKRLAK